MWGYVYMSVVAHGALRGLGSRELELQVVVRCLAWVQGTGLKPSAGNRTQALCRSSPHLQSLSRLSTLVLTTLQRFSINLKDNSNSNLVWFMRPVSQWPRFTSPGPPPYPACLNFLASAMGAFALSWALRAPTGTGTPSTHSVLKGSPPPAPSPSIIAWQSSPGDEVVHHHCAIWNHTRDTLLGTSVRTFQRGVTEVRRLSLSVGGTLPQAEVWD